MFALLRYGLRVWATISFDGEGGKKRFYLSGAVTLFVEYV